jgi:competence protein ComEC
VLLLAQHAAAWPQLGVVGAGCGLVGLAAFRVRRTRGLAIAGVAAWLVVATAPAPTAGGAHIVFLDVNQGDAILITDGHGSVALVDGGRDPEVLRVALARHGITEIDLLVATHGDVDHVGGLAGVTEAYGVEAFWHPRLQPTQAALDDLATAAVLSGARVVAAGTGDTAQLGGVHLQVMSPLRRFAGDNDGSIVLWVTAGGASVLLTGDVEAVGQAELPAVRPDVLQVPHHGSATTDLEWLAETVGDVAVISVGANTYGHPSPLVLDVLRSRAAQVLSTQADGDVVIPLGP